MNPKKKNPSGIIYAGVAIKVSEWHILRINKRIHAKIPLVRAETNA